MKINGIEVSKVLEFNATSGFGGWKKYFPKESVAHPAKINLNLLEYLILNYTSENDLILDPMAGTFSTVVMAMLNNRRGIGVELEEKFCKWGKEAIKNVENEQTLTPKGKGIAIKGDARNLSEVLKEHEEEISSVLFSPPYGEAHQNKNLGLADGNRKDLRAYSWLKSDNQKNIENLPFNTDCIVTSPPYAETISKNAGGSISYERIGISSKTIREYSDDRENIGNIKNLGLSIDSVLTSPPYFDSKSDWDETSRGKKEEGEAVSYADERHAEKKNIGNVHYFDEGKPLNKKHAKANGKETYISAMRLVYEQCFLVLKPQGLLILILKNFIRQKKLVPLTEHTVKLCESVGFELKERLLFRLPQQSFWRILGKKQWETEGREYPKDLSYEHILIFKK